MYLVVESHIERSITGAADLIETNIAGRFTRRKAARVLNRLAPAKEASTGRCRAWGELACPSAETLPRPSCASPKSGTKFYRRHQLGAPTNALDFADGILVVVNPGRSP